MNLEIYGTWWTTDFADAPAFKSAFPPNGDPYPTRASRRGGCYAHANACWALYRILGRSYP